MPSRLASPSCLVVLALGSLIPGDPAPAQQPNPTAGLAVSPSDPIERIKEEARERSQVMETVSFLTDVIGPRLTASPAAKRANECTRDKLAGWGLENAKLEPWGEFGRGWTLRRFSIQVVEPQCIPLIAFPLAWSPGTDGPVTGPVVDFDAVKSEADLDALKSKSKGKLKNAFILLGPARDVPAHFVPRASRLTDSELLHLANAPDASTRRLRLTPAPPRELLPGDPSLPVAEQLPSLRLLWNKHAFAMEEGAAAILEGSPKWDGGTVLVGPANVPIGPIPGPGQPGPRRVSSWDKVVPGFLPQVTLSKEQYNRLLRMVRRGENLKITLDLGVQFHDGEDSKTFNTVAEIPGADLKDEVVMLGAHMDSWHGGTGATDNAAGVAVAMEAVRIIRALDLKPRRTIRIALWTGEEQGLLGSRAYVREHFGELGSGPPAAGASPRARQPKLTSKPDYEKFSAYYNLDNGTGRIRGIYLQGNEAAGTVFRPWLGPFRDMGASTITIANTGATDHMPFDAIGLPGFQFIQDKIEYDTLSYHSNQDLYDRVQADDLRQSAAIMAAFAFNSANLDRKIPRKQGPAFASPATAAGE